MGIIDKTTYLLTCLDCGVSEEASVLDKGSSYGGSCWNAKADFSKFDTSWQGEGGFTEPTLENKKCKLCGSLNIKVG